MFGVVSDSDSEDELKEEEPWAAVHPTNECGAESVPALVTKESKSNCQLHHRTSEEVSRS